MTKDQRTREQNYQKMRGQKAFPKSNVKQRGLLEGAGRGGGGGWGGCTHPLFEHNARMPGFERVRVALTQIKSS